MYVPTAVAIIVALLAVPTVLLLLMAFHDFVRSQRLSLLGGDTVFLEDGTTITRWCLLYVPLWTTRGVHSTMLN